jgi:hypothetical protein
MSGGMGIGGSTSAQRPGQGGKNQGNAAICRVAALTSKAEDNIMRPLCRDEL